MKILILFCLLALGATAQGQFIYKAGKSTAKVDTLKANGSVIKVKDNTGTWTLAVSAGGDSTKFKSIYQASLDTTKLHNQIITKLSTTGTAANSNLLQGRDSTYIKAHWGGTVVDTTNTPVLGHYGTRYGEFLKVDKVTGKGLSTNDLTATLKTKYDSVSLINLRDSVYVYSFVGSSTAIDLSHHIGVEYNLYDMVTGPMTLTVAAGAKTFSCASGVIRADGVTIPNINVFTLFSGAYENTNDVDNYWFAIYRNGTFYWYWAQQE
jgi:hypothetical protein